MRIFMNKYRYEITKSCFSSPTPVIQIARRLQHRGQVRAAETRSWHPVAAPSLKPGRWGPVLVPASSTWCVAGHWIMIWFSGTNLPSMLKPACDLDDRRWRRENSSLVISLTILFINNAYPMHECNYNVRVLHLKFPSFVNWNTISFIRSETELWQDADY